MLELIFILDRECPCWVPMQPHGRPLTLWNRGRVVGQKLALKLRDIFGVKVRPQLQRPLAEIRIIYRTIYRPSERWQSFDWPGFVYR